MARTQKYAEQFREVIEKDEWDKELTKNVKKNVYMIRAVNIKKRVKNGFQKSTNKSKGNVPMIIKKL